MPSDIINDIPDSGQEPIEPEPTPAHMTYSEALWIGITTVHFQVFGHPRADYSRDQLLAGMNILWVEYLKVKLDELGM